MKSKTNNKKNFVKEVGTETAKILVISTLCAVAAPFITITNFVIWDKLDKKYSR